VQDVFLPSFFKTKMESVRHEILRLVEEILPLISEGHYIKLCNAIQRYEPGSEEQHEQCKEDKRKLRAELASYKRSTETLMDMLVELHSLMDDINAANEKILNPKTGRMIRKNSRLGRKIISEG